MTCLPKCVRKFLNWLSGKRSRFGWTKASEKLPRGPVLVASAHTIFQHACDSAGNYVEKQAQYFYESDDLTFIYDCHYEYLIAYPELIISDQGDRKWYWMAGRHNIRISALDLWKPFDPHFPWGKDIFKNVSKEEYKKFFEDDQGPFVQEEIKT